MDLHSNNILSVVISKWDMVRNGWLGKRVRH